MGGVRFVAPGCRWHVNLSLSEDREPMDEDATGDETAPRRTGDLSEYNLDTYDDEDDGPASSASGHAVFGITTIYPAQLLVPSPT